MKRCRFDLRLSRPENTHNVGRPSEASRSLPQVRSVRWRPDISLICLQAWPMLPARVDGLPPLLLSPFTGAITWIRPTSPYSKTTRPLTLSPFSHRIREFRIVSTAKAVHRLASGTHRKWDFPLRDGTTAPLEMHVYPRSSGRVLRIIGEMLEECCAAVTGRDRDTIRQLKQEKFGLHPSQEPGWRPAWQRQREAAARG